MVINAALFIVSKMIMKKTGSNLMNMINSMNSATPKTTEAPRRKRRMRGPTINLDDMPDINEVINETDNNIQYD